MNRYIKYIIEALVHNEPNKFFTDVLGYGDGDGAEDNAVVLAALDGVSVMGDNDKHILKLFKSTLCKSGEYHRVIASTPEVPTVYKVSEIEYYAAPWSNFKLFNYVDIDKKPSYPIGRFYRYHIIFEGTKIHLFVTLSKLSDKIVINEYISSFILNSIEPIEYIKFHSEDPDNAEKDKTIKYKDWSPVMLLMIFAPKDKDGKDIKFNDNYVDNFPVKLDPPAYEYAKPARLWKKSCETPEVFYRFAKKLINAGWQVQDEEKNIYKTIEDVDNNEEYISSGQKAADLQKQEDEHLQFLINQLGEDTVNKLSIAIDAAIAADNNRNAGKTYNSIYLKSINRLRKVKICYELTFIPMALSNNIQLDEKVALSKSIKGAVLYKLMYNAQEFNMQDYRPKGTKSSGGIYSLKSCTEYFIEDDYDEYGGPEFTKILDINDLPIKIFNVQSLYKLYFLIGVTLKQINGIDRIDELKQALARYDKTIDSTKPYLYSDYPEWNSFYNERDVSRYNNDIRDMNGVDFTVLNEQLTHIANYYSKAAKKRK